MTHKKLTLDELVIVPELRKPAREMLEKYVAALDSLPTFINRYNMGREIKDHLNEHLSETLKLYTKEIAEGYDGRLCFEDVLTFNAVGAMLVDHLNDTIRPGANKEAKEMEDAKIAAMTPSQREQYNKAKQNPLIKMIGMDPAELIGEPGAGGSFDA